MAVDTAGITALYDSMIAKYKSVLDAEFDAGKITSDMYTKSLVALMQNTMQLASSITQQQPLIEAQTALATAQELKVDAEILTEGSKKLLIDAQKLLADAQTAKMNAETAFVGNQSTQLTASVTYNNKIKALDSYSDMIGTMGAGSLTISTDMWSTYFSMVNDLNSSGSIPTDKTITKLT